MTIKQYALTAICAMSMLGGCTFHGLSVEKEQPEAKLQRVWLLTNFQGFDRSDLTQLQAKMDLTALPNATANMGCNQLNFQAQVKSDFQIQFGPVASTRKFCGDRMNLERQFSQQIGQIKHFRTVGQHHLVLRNDRGEEIMRFVAQDQN